ncbi:MAG: tol-pal system protein YbgF [Nitrospirales bacterium]|nr:tol-pal system protein YbgF [Nitrospirales bacterium]
MNARSTGLISGLLALGMAALLAACATTQDVETASRQSQEKTEEVRASLGNKIEQVNKLQRQAEEQQAVLEKLLKDTQGQLSTAQQRNAELETRVQEIKGQDLSGLQGQLETIRRDLDGLQSGLDDQKAQVFSLNQKVAGRLEEQAAKLAGVDKTVGKMTETVQAIAGKLSTQVEQQAQSLARLDETTKQADVQVKALTAELGKFQVVLSEFDKVLRVLSDRAPGGDHQASDGQAMKTLAAKADQQAARMDALEKTLNTVGAAQKETSGSLGALKRAMEESAGKAAAHADGPRDVPPPPAQSSVMQTEPPRPAGAAPRTTPESALSAKDAYDRAQGQYGKGQYDIALTSFKLFLIQYPDSSLVPNAHFWMAECYFRTRDYERGIEEYEQVAKNYPKSEKASRALYRKAIAFLELNDANAARTTLRQLIAAYPNSEDSKQARIKLASLK